MLTRSTLVMAALTLLGGCQRSVSVPDALPLHSAANGCLSRVAVAAATSVAPAANIGEAALRTCFSLVQAARNETWVKLEATTPRTGKPDDLQLYHQVNANLADAEFDLARGYVINLVAAERKRAGRPDYAR
jgi:hypothetical protein